MRSTYIVKKLGVEVECQSTEKYYFPFEELPSVEVGDRVSAASGATWNSLADVLPEPPSYSEPILQPPPAKIPLPVSHVTDASLDPSSVAFRLVGIEDVSDVFRKQEREIEDLKSRVKVLEIQLRNHIGMEPPSSGGGSRLR